MAKAKKAKKTTKKHVATAKKARVTTIRHTGAVHMRQHRVHLHVHSTRTAAKNPWKTITV